MLTSMGTTLNTELVRDKSVKSNIFASFRSRREQEALVLLFFLFLAYVDHPMMSQTACTAFCNGEASSLLWGTTCSCYSGKSANYIYTFVQSMRFHEAFQIFVSKFEVLRLNISPSDSVQLQITNLGSRVYQKRPKLDKRECEDFS